ncbi:MAG: ChbG/HpnK family deacetylase, partial [Candidatus Gastranaerophilales bacterium]|nr:ChbG/HpnK family deacetylase [Candidatus Gastranaerophilales bacterium]
MKKLIINADDFGYSKENNEAVKLGYESGIITSASIMANMNGFEHAVKEIFPAAQNLDLGFHFNIIEGKSLSAASLLCDSNNNFNSNYIQMIGKSSNKKFLNQIEQEFRTQIEKVLKYCSISHIDSHVHIHSIPAIFNLIIKLAGEYGIKYIRTQKEIPYIIWNKSFNGKYPVNILKNIILNNYTN